MLLHHCREPDVRRQLVQTSETRRSDTDDCAGQRLDVAWTQVKRLSDDRRVRLKLVLPECMADDRRWRLIWALIILRKKGPALDRHHAQRGEIIRRRKL